MRKKRQFHCENCHSPCEIYKKGKNHRVLVCPKCGILATNPLPLIAGLAAAKLAKPLLSKAAGAFLGSSTPSAQPSAKPSYTKHIEDSLDKPNKNERYVEMALKG